MNKLYANFLYRYFRNPFTISLLFFNPPMCVYYFFWITLAKHLLPIGLVPLWQEGLVRALPIAMKLELDLVIVVSVCPAGLLATDCCNSHSSSSSNGRRVYRTLSSVHCCLQPTFTTSNSALLTHTYTCKKEPTAKCNIEKH